MKRALSIICFLACVVALFSFPTDYELSYIYGCRLTCYIKDRVIIGQFHRLDTTHIYMIPKTDSIYNDRNSLTSNVIIPIHDVDSLDFFYNIQEESKTDIHYTLTKEDLNRLIKQAANFTRKIDDSFISIDRMDSLVVIITTKFRINSASGCEFSAKIKNLITNPIKYITLTMLPYNEVGDSVSCSISGNTYANAQATGFIDYKQTRSYSWEPIWYNATITAVKVTSVKITYKDGSVKQLKSNDEKLLVLN